MQIFPVKFCCPGAQGSTEGSCGDWIVPTVPFFFSNCFVLFSPSHSPVSLAWLHFPSTYRCPPGIALENCFQPAASSCQKIRCRRSSRFTAIAFSEPISLRTQRSASGTFRKEYNSLHSLNATYSSRICPRNNTCLSWFQRVLCHDGCSTGPSAKFSRSSVRAVASWKRLLSLYIAVS
jgi:hypothetical protein